MLSNVNIFGKPLLDNQRCSRSCQIFLLYVRIQGPVFTRIEKHTDYRGSYSLHLYDHMLCIYPFEHIRSPGHPGVSSLISEPELSAVVPLIKQRSIRNFVSRMSECTWRRERGRSLRCLLHSKLHLILVGSGSVVHCERQAKSLAAVAAVISR